jgi:hypothetical protein
MSVRIVLVGMLSGCYAPAYGNCDITCVGGTCPSGFDCVASVCVAPGQTCAPTGDGRVSDVSGSDSAALVPWGSASPILFANSPDLDDPSLRDDMVEMYANLNGADIVRLTRLPPATQWSAPTVVSELDSSASTDAPEISGDGLHLVYSTDYQFDVGQFDLQRTARPQGGTFTTPAVGFPNVNTTSLDSGPSLDRTKLVLYFDSARSGMGDIFVTTRPTADEAAQWSAPQPIAAVNLADKREEGPRISEDGLTLYFASNRNGNLDLFVSLRPSKTAEFGAPVPISELNTTEAETDPWVSPDGKTIYFARTSNATGTSTIWTATR